MTLIASNFQWQFQRILQWLKLLLRTYGYDDLLDCHEVFKVQLDKISLHEVLKY